MKLLQRTVRSYLVFSMLVMLIAIPVLYFIIQALCLQDVDEVLQIRKHQLISHVETHTGILDHLPWHDINNEIFIAKPGRQASEEQNITLQHYSTLNGEYEPFRELHTFITVNDVNYPVIIRISLIDIEDLIQGIVIAVILLMALILAGLLWINRQQSKKLWKPFYQALHQLQQFTMDKKPTLQFSPTSIEEFKDLQQEITQLTERTYRTYLQQKEFTENASHELQTPLASLQAKLELLMQEETLSREQANIIQSLNDTIIRMARLNKGLLLLAKIENKQFTEGIAINLDAVVRRLLTSLEMQVKFRQLTVVENYEGSVIQANPILTDILVSNLLNNAIQHTPKNGAVSISTLPGILEVSNSGEPLPFAEKNLFQRFQKGGSAASGGSGLGLAIVKQICDTCHYGICYRYENNMHRFIVRFNPAPY